MPKVSCGIEMGVGTGRFAVPLGIRWGMDPSIRMVKMAKARGLQVVAARAEAYFKIRITLKANRKWLWDYA